jgi:DNA-binding HxlR family transcriptional regulator
MPRTTAAQSQIEAKRGPQLRRVSGLSEDNPDFRLIHERLRLAIVSALAVNAALTFTELREMLGITDGNLSVHCRKLEEGGLIVCAKGFVGRVPRSEYKLTPRGRRAFQRYLEHMESLIKAVRKAT